MRVFQQTNRRRGLLTSVCNELLETHLETTYPIMVSSLSVSYIVDDKVATGKFHQKFFLGSLKR